MGNDTYEVNGWYLSENSGGTQISFGGETNNTAFAITTDNGPGNWPSGPANWAYAWSMVTITYDGTNNLLIYLNAALQATTNTFASPVSSTTYLIFGLGTANNGYSDLDGDMWLPQIWSTNLWPADVANLYFNQTHGSPWP